MSAITVNGVGKAYKQFPGQWSRLLDILVPELGPRYHQKWVLRNISFSVAAGEAVGLIGVNGAGKSTLLKIISGVTRPTEGVVGLSGRVSALLELGTGFHPDFTGRQNVQTAATILGLSPEEIAEVTPDILRFADIGDYVDQPVRTYSSGMQVRLAFAVATAIRPDVLIVDEALAVGDALFQRKCYRRIESFLESGTSLLFVSHSIESVKKICERALFIDRGEAVAIGAAKEVCDQYENWLFSGSRHGGMSAVQHAAAHADPAAVEEGEIDQELLASEEVTYGDGGATIEKVWIEDRNGRRANVVTSGDVFSICYLASFNDEAIVDPVVAMLIKSLDGLALYGTDSVSLGVPMPREPKTGRFLIRFRLLCSLANGVYFLNCGIRHGANRAHFHHRRVDVLMFRVRKRDDFGQIGMVNLRGELAIERLK